MAKTNTSNPKVEGEIKTNQESESEIEINLKNSDDLVISKSKMVIIQKLLRNIRDNNERLLGLLSGNLSEEEEARIGIGQISDEEFAYADEEGREVEVEGRVIEGVFDGENMIGPDGKQYNVPANYASKSKLVEGDILKLTITPSGTFIYKQIGPIDRIRIVGKLEAASAGNFFVTAESKKWRVLTASVTYYKGQVGDEAVILVPKAGESKWAAVEILLGESASQDYNFSLPER